MPPLFTVKLLPLLPEVLVPPRKTSVPLLTENPVALPLKFQPEVLPFGADRYSVPPPFSERALPLLVEFRRACMSRLAPAAMLKLKLRPWRNWVLGLALESVA